MIRKDAFPGTSMSFGSVSNYVTFDMTKYEQRTTVALRFRNTPIEVMLLACKSLVIGDIGPNVLSIEKASILIQFSLPIYLPLFHYGCVKYIPFVGRLGACDLHIPTCIQDHVISIM
ncbi:hypothetical protein DI09_184p30 [Mitosporidium daphniae]|uniref:Uncharacterized protein n=1 Tax=Mitosporidium daphniae TaxID=1485682 RepID=A0A098VX92_9MICR|nr:uncharacterized protein DI09_184p30 [Mitosporidium daphniae]KGG52351.1 hypothetical protein DI09_184p30 [Mitosporidium daphniae]|eukprot:XP_013238787.1 uncharacterized protein DI09_184p30 [Mitosporidium daphniae]